MKCVLFSTAVAIALTSAVHATTPTWSDMSSNIRHIIWVMMENRSATHYFGTFKGSHGQGSFQSFNAATCYPISYGATCGTYPSCGSNCVAPFHDRHGINAGAVHRNAMPGDCTIAESDSNCDVDKGAMDNFVARQQDKGIDANCSGPLGNIIARCNGAIQGYVHYDVVGYHTSAEIPNYWTLADTFVMLDHMYPSTTGYSLPSHTYIVSEWAAKNCHTTGCVSDENFSRATEKDYLWSNLMRELDCTGVAGCNGAPVSWKMYKNARPAGAAGTSETIWNVVPDFDYVARQGASYIAQHNPDFQDANTGFQADLNNTALPTVSWVIPASPYSEHPLADIDSGQNFVSSVVNAVMASSYWTISKDVMIVVTWDDWGGFLDQQAPPYADSIGAENYVGYGIRVPALIISPWTIPHKIDHATMSFDAIVVAIEKMYLTALSNAKIGGRGGLFPDARKQIREARTKVCPWGDTQCASPISVGDIRHDFCFPVNGCGTPNAAIRLSTLIPESFKAAPDTLPPYEQHGKMNWRADYSNPARVASWKIYYSPTSGGPYTLVTSGGCASPMTAATHSCRDTSHAGTLSYYVMTSVDINGVESPKSYEIAVTP